MKIGKQERREGQIRSESDMERFEKAEDGADESEREEGSECGRD